VTSSEIISEIFKIVEKDLMKRDLSGSEVYRLNSRVLSLLDELPDGYEKTKVKKKLDDKKRFGYYINNSGNKNLTGYGEHLA